MIMTMIMIMFQSNDLTKIKELGRGQFGSVSLCRCAKLCLSHPARHTIR